MDEFGQPLRDSGFTRYADVIDEDGFAYSTSIFGLEDEDWEDDTELNLLDI